MGFSIGRFIGSIAPAIGGLFGGPVGAIVGAGIGSALNEPERPVGRALAPAQQRQLPVAPTSVVPTAVNRIPFAALPTTTRLPSLAGFGGPLVRGAAALATGFAVSDFFGNGNGRSQISIILAKARQTFGPGVTKRKIIAAAKACGIDVAAGTFGLDPREICVVIIAGSGRRRRGISAADVRRTRRTIRFVNSVRKDLKKLSMR